MKPILLCLHGWGGSKDSFKELRAALKGKKIEILTPDLPGFGKEPEPKRAWNVDDYANWVEKFVMKKMPKAKNQKPTLLVLGHSHGGRIAIKLAIRQRSEVRGPRSEVLPPIRHLYLCAAAGIRHPRHWRRILGLTLSKTGKIFCAIPLVGRLAPLGRKFLYKLIRVHDYEKASPLMKQTMIEVVKEDFRPLLKKIKLPTDIFWGADDRMTPLKDGKLMHKLIRGSRLHIYKGTRHGVHRERAREIGKIVLSII